MASVSNVSRHWTTLFIADTNCVSHRKEPDIHAWVVRDIHCGGARIGDNVTIFHHVTIDGVNTDSQRKGAPAIGNDCVLYPGCSVVGKVAIGNGCQIGPNVVVWFDVPDGSTVLIERSSVRVLGR